MTATNPNAAIRFLWAMNAPHLIGRLLKEKRAALGLTEFAAAQAAGVSLRNLQRLEKGEFHNMRSSTRERLARFYKLDPDELRAPVAEPAAQGELREQIDEVLIRLQRIEVAIDGLTPSPAAEFEQAMGTAAEPPATKRRQRAAGARAKRSSPGASRRAQR